MAYLLHLSHDKHKVVKIAICQFILLISSPTSTPSRRIDNNKIHRINWWMKFKSFHFIQILFFHCPLSVPWSLVWLDLCLFLFLKGNAIQFQLEMEKTFKIGCIPSNFLIQWILWSGSWNKALNFNVAYNYIALISTSVVLQQSNAITKLDLFCNWL